MSRSMFFTHYWCKTLLGMTPNVINLFAPPLLQRGVPCEFSVSCEVEAVRRGGGTDETMRKAESAGMRLPLLRWPIRLAMKEPWLCSPSCSSHGQNLLPPRVPCQSAAADLIPNILLTVLPNVQIFLATCSDLVSRSILYNDLSGDHQYSRQQLCEV